MKVLGIALALATIMAAPAIAQEHHGIDPSGYVTVFGGPAWSDGNSTGSVLFEGGRRIAPHTMLFGNVGRFANLQGDLQPTLDATTAASSTQGVTVAATGSLPAWYGLGGVRAEIPASDHFVPYVLGGIGAARLTPTAQFTFTGGIMPDGSTPAVGTDVTSTLTSAGIYTAPATSTAFMFMLGGGAQVPLASRWAVDLGYRYSRIAADSTLSASPLNTNAVTFGFGYRF